jgi:predicted alpha/beta superfamily hydrolase
MCGYQMVTHPLKNTQCYICTMDKCFLILLTTGKQEWDVDEWVGKLMKEKKIIDCIVVGVWNVPANRFADYFPEKVLTQIAEPARSQILAKQIKEKQSADNYLKFLVTEVKPFIDSVYSTKRDVKNTFIMGSSMGALISAYALCEYPNVFGGAACLSIHSPLAAPDLINEKTDEEVASKLRNYLTAHLPKADTRKIYFDYGDQTLDSLYKTFSSQDIFLQLLANEIF